LVDDLVEAAPLPNELPPVEVGPFVTPNGPLLWRSNRIINVGNASAISKMIIVAVLFVFCIEMIISRYTDCNRRPRDDTKVI